MMADVEPKNFIFAGNNLIRWTLDLTAAEMDFLVTKETEKCHACSHLMIFHFDKGDCRICGMNQCTATRGILGG